MRDQTVVIHGAGTAGIGIADVLRQVMIDDGLSLAEATSRFYALGSKGLLTSDYPGTLRDFQVPYARPAAEVADWQRDQDGRIGLAEVVTRSRPTMLIGTSTQPGAFSEAIVTEMAAHVARPVIMPLSNPTSHSEAQAADLIAWTGGRALIATGSPFPPVDYAGVQYQVAQANNALIFPGLGLGVTVSRARRVSDGMLAAAASALASLSDADRPGAAVLPSVTSLRDVSAAVAEAVARPPRPRDCPMCRSTAWPSGCARPCGNRLTPRWRPSDRLARAPSRLHQHYAVAARGSAILRRAGRLDRREAASVGIGKAYRMTVTTAAAQLQPAGIHHGGRDPRPAVPAHGAPPRAGPVLAVTARPGQGRPTGRLLYACRGSGARLTLLCLTRGRRRR